MEELRSLISQQVSDLQGFIESSKFELGTASPEKIARLTADAQSVFLVLLAVARHERKGTALPESVREAIIQLDLDMATALAAVAECVQGLGATPCIDVDDAIGAIERSVSGQMDLGQRADKACVESLALYRELAVAVQRLARAA